MKTSTTCASCIYPRKTRLRDSTAVFECIRVSHHRPVIKLSLCEHICNVNHQLVIRFLKNLMIQQFARRYVHPRIAHDRCVLCESVFKLSPNDITVCGVVVVVATKAGALQHV